MWRLPHTSKPFSGASRVSENSAQFWHCLPGLESASTGKGLHPTRPLQLRMPTASPGSYLRFWLTGYKLEAPMTPSSGLINLLEQLTEPRKTLSLTRLLIYSTKLLEDLNRQMKRHIGQGMGKGHGASMPSPGETLSPVSTCSPTWKLSEPPFFWVFIVASLHKHKWLNFDHWRLVQPPGPLPSLRTGWDWKFQLSNHILGSPGSQPPSFARIQKSSLLKHFQELRMGAQVLFHCPYCSGNSKGSGHCESGTVDEDQIYVRNIYIWSSEWPNMYISYKSRYCTAWAKTVFLPSMLGKESAKPQVDRVPDMWVQFATSWRPVTHSLYKLGQLGSREGKGSPWWAWGAWQHGRAGTQNLRPGRTQLFLVPSSGGFLVYFWPQAELPRELCNLAC